MVGLYQILRFVFFLYFCILDWNKAIVFKSCILMIMSDKNERAVCSTVRLVGQLNARAGLKPTDLEKQAKVWKRHTLSKEEFDSLNKTYYTAHILSMTEAEGEKDRAVDLAEVRRFIYSPENGNINLPLRKFDYKQNEVVTLHEEYACNVRNISVWFFPYTPVLFSIEIDDSGNALNDITLMHSQWKNWAKQYDDFFGTEELKKILEPLLKLTCNEQSPAKLTFQDTKLRQYQVVQVDEPTLRDDLLYELATHSRIGVVADGDLHAPFKPSEEYFSRIIRDNSVSAFSNWKALALNDTFTVLAIDGIFCDSELDSNGDGYRYFEMLYMRCLVQEYYCFSRNNDYRENPKKLDAKDIRQEIESMEKYYFYDDLSYEFLPPLMYGAMAKGLGLDGDRRELTERVKQGLIELQRREEEQRRLNNDITIGAVKLFSVVTVVWTVYQMLCLIFGDCFKGWVSALVALVLSLALTYLFVRPLIRTLIQNRRK